MEIKWSNDRKHQIEYYVHQAKNVKNELFQKMRAIVLPYLHPDAWYLPDYDLFKNKEFRRRLENIRQDWFEITDIRLLEMVEEKFDQYIDQINEQDQEMFEREAREFLAICQELLPVVKKVNSLTVIPTKFGTGASHFMNKNESGVNLTVTYRLDKGYVYALRGLLSVLVQLTMEDDDTNINNWRLRIGVADFLAFDTVFNKFFEGKMNRTLQFIDEYKGELIEDAITYFAKMGYPLESMFKAEKEGILFNNKPIIGLSNKEIEVLELLIDRKRQIVTFDQLGEMYWKNEPDKFSLQALAKLIEKLRRSLEKNGINESYIRTVRKRGYLLFD
jgi:hypothetical protein